jgi:hypothetical protein
MQINLYAGERIAPCISHDGPFEANPMWVRYDATARKLSVVLENGGQRQLTTPVNDDIAKHLGSARKIMLVRLHGGRPVEGYECHLRKFDGAGHELATA